MKTAKETNPVYERLRKLCSDNKTSIIKVYRELYGREKSEGNLATWKKGNFTLYDLNEISKKFNVTTDFLIKGEIMEKQFIDNISTENGVSVVNSTNENVDNSFNVSTDINKPQNELVSQDIYLKRVLECWERIPKECTHHISDIAKILADESNLNYSYRCFYQFFIYFYGKGIFTNYDFIRILGLLSSIKEKDISELYCLLYSKINELGYKAGELLNEFNEDYKRPEL